jgi:carbonic anhydrase
MSTQLENASAMTDAEILSANERYAAHFTWGDLPSPPRRRIAVVTCMDARLDPAHFLGLEEGDAHVIRNAGGVVSDDALRSLIVSHWLLGTQSALVIGHTDCGMAKFTDEELRARLRASTGADPSDVDFLTFGAVDEAVRQSVDRIQATQLLPPEFGASGFVYDVATGRLTRVA